MSSRVKRVRASGATTTYKLHHRDRRTFFRTGRTMALSSPSSSSSSPPGKKKSFAILVTGSPFPEVVKKHGDFTQRFLGLLSESEREERGRERGEEWDAFRVFEGESHGDLSKYDGIVVTGSKFDAHAQDQWILDLIGEIRACHEREQRILGVCFGHQIVARALGGKVERSQNGWSLGANEIAFDVDKVNKLCKRLSDALRDDDEDGCEKIAIHQVHQDEVIELPPGAQVIASSPECENEAFLVGSHIMGVQGHPEFDNDMVRDIIDLKKANGMEESITEEGLAQLKEHALDRSTSQKWGTICRDFLKK